MEKQKAVLVRGNIICAGEVTAAGYDLMVFATEDKIKEYDVVVEFTGDVRCDDQMIHLSGIPFLVTGDIIAYGLNPDGTVKSVGECVEY